MSRFSTPRLSDVKKALWNLCASELSSLKLPRHSLDDIVLASSKLTKIDRIPLIYCKAPNLVKLPYRISVDYCNESKYSSKINFWHSKSVEYITVISRKYAHGR